MKTINLRKEWGKITQEINDKPKYEDPYPEKVVFSRGLLLLAQVLLEKIGNKEGVSLNTIIYQKIMAE